MLLIGHTENHFTPLSSSVFLCLTLAVQGGFGEGLEAFIFYDLSQLCFNYQQDFDKARDRKRASIYEIPLEKRRSRLSEGHTPGVLTE